MEALISHKESPYIAGANTFKWTDDIKLLVARYVADHYTAFKMLGENGGRKIDFVRKMRTELNLHCTDKQLKNCLDFVIKQYRTVRDKLNSKGFSILSESEETQKNWIFMKCPHFDILDAVMATRPNITPSVVLNSDSFDGIGLSVESCYETELFDSGTPQAAQPSNDESLLHPIVQVELETTSSNESSATANRKRNRESPALEGLVRNTVPSVGVNSRRRELPKNALGAFSTLVAESQELLHSTQSKQLKLEEEKFIYMKIMDQKKLEHEKEMAKLSDERRWAHEKELAKLSDERRWAHEKEMAILNMKALRETKELEWEIEQRRMQLAGELELEKLKLQIELEKIKKLN